jgi:hypothetical protein
MLSDDSDLDGEDDASEEDGSEEFDGFDCLGWYDFFVEIATELVDDFDEADFQEFKVVTNKEAFAAACEKLSDATTRVKIDEILTRCGVNAVGTKKKKVEDLMMWKSGR